MSALAAQQQMASPPVPGLRGKWRQNAELAKVTWFQVGGPAEWLFKPEDADDLAQFLARKPKHLPAVVIGVGSNLLVRDGGLSGVVVRLGRGFTEVSAEGDIVTAGAGALDVNVAEFACAQGIGGLEFLCGIPGTIGGALAMNAGAYGADMSQVLVDAVALDGQGNRHVLTSEQMGFSYRHNSVPGDWIFVSARLRGKPDDKAAIASRMKKITTERASTQPVRSRTGGSTFTNPPGAKAWELIDRAGCRGLTKGAAQVSDKHCNFLINTGGASAADLEALGEEVRARVKAATGIELQWEIKRVGKNE